MTDETRPTHIATTDIEAWLECASDDLDDIDNSTGLNSGGIVMLLNELVRRVKELERKSDLPDWAQKKGV